MLASLKARLTEGSSWAGISAALGTLGTQLPGHYAHGCYAVSAAAAVAAVLTKDKGSA